jgi:hypothetical protein
MEQLICVAFGYIWYMSVQVNDRKLAQQFYNKTKSWQVEANSLEIDLMFFMRILDIYALKISEPTEKRDVNLLKETVSSFLNHRMDNVKNRLKTHEEYLQKVVEDRILLKDKDLPYRHRDMEEEFGDFRKGGGGLKNDLYLKVERLKQF